MDLERGNVIAGYAGLTEPSDFNKNILICVPKINDGLGTAWERIINDIIFIFGWTIKSMCLYEIIFLIFISAFKGLIHFRIKISW